MYLTNDQFSSRDELNARARDLLERFGVPPQMIGESVYIPREALTRLSPPEALTRLSPPEALTRIDPLPVRGTEEWAHASEEERTTCAPTRPEPVAEPVREKPEYPAWVCAWLAAIERSTADVVDLNIAAEIHYSEQADPVTGWRYSTPTGAILVEITLTGGATLSHRFSRQEWRAMHGANFPG